MPESEQITAQGLAALRAEIEQLETQGRAGIAERIKAARQLGGLKENAEYHIAKDDQAHLETKIRRLRERLRNAVVVETAIDSNTFSFGRTAEVTDEATGKTRRWTLVGQAEADAALGRLSVESPVGAALRDKRVRETVAVDTPGGERRYRVDRLV